MRATIASSVLCQLSQVLRETSVPGQANVPAPFQHMYCVVYCTPRRNFLAVKCQLHSSDHLHAGVDAHDHTVHGALDQSEAHIARVQLSGGGHFCAVVFCFIVCF